MIILSPKLAKGLPDQPIVFCPGCKEIHRFDSRWEWDGDVDKPTFSPSMLVTSPDHKDKNKQVCHSFLKKGIWQFLNDCTHKLAGQKIPLPDLPDWILE